MLLPTILAIVAAGVAGSFTDWLFMGVLFHAAYDRYPEIWRPSVREGGERVAILWSTALGMVITTAVVALCVLARVHTIAGGLGVGALAWLAGPPVVILNNHLFIKFDARVTFAHCLGYLARSLLAGLAAGVALTWG